VAIITPSKLKVYGHFFFGHEASLYLFQWTQLKLFLLQDLMFFYISVQMIALGKIKQVSSFKRY